MIKIYLVKYNCIFGIRNRSINRDSTAFQPAPRDNGDGWQRIVNELLHRAFSKENDNHSLFMGRRSGLLTWKIWFRLESVQYLWKGKCTDGNVLERLCFIHKNTSFWSISYVDEIFIVSLLYQGTYCQKMLLDIWL